MDLHQLRVFRAAAQAGGFTRAGQQLLISQSTVSQHIKDLEAELGCPLFLRVGKRVMVTEAGRVLLLHAEGIFQHMENAEIAVREMTALKRGTVRLGAGATTLIYRLPRVLREYKRRFPEIELIITTGTSESLLAGLRSHRLDLAVVVSPAAEAGLEVSSLGREELVVILNRRHPLARRSRLTPRDLATLPFILYEKETAMQSVVEEFFRSLGISPRIIMEIENSEVNKSLVGAGLGASIVPLCSVAKPSESARLKVMRVRGQTCTRELGLVTLDAAIHPRAIRELAASISAGLRETARPESLKSSI
jgi:LysR family transcriptional activator of glutamate synthase operon